jgi:hypothetical protein
VTERADKLMTVLAAVLASVSWFLCESREGVSYEGFFLGLFLVGVLWACSLRKESLPACGGIEKVLLVGVSMLSFAYLAGPAALLWASPLYGSLALALLCRKRLPVLGYLESALYSVLLAAMLIVILEGAYEWLLWFTYDSTILDHLISPVLALVGVPNVLTRQGIVVGDGRNTDVIHYGLDRVHVIWMARFVLAYFLLLGVYGGYRAGIRLLAVVLLRAAFVSLVWMVGSFLLWNYTKQPHLFISRPLYFLSDFVAVVLLLPFCRSRLVVRSPTTPLHRGFASPIRLGLQLTVGLLVVFCTWFPVGPKKPNDRVLVDDHYSAWEISDSPFNFTEDGMTKKAAYSYTNFVDYIKYFYPIDINKDKSLDQCPLNDYSVVLLKTNTRPFSENDIRALLAFVRRGGGLFIHGDHTNLFGMSENFNAFLKHLGIKYNMDDEAGYYGQPSLYQRPPGRCVHPTVANVGQFQFLTSCTLKTSNPLVEPVFTCGDIFSEQANYGRPGFFSNMVPDARDRTGHFLQAAVVPYGKGRVAVFTDSTVFSNFAAFQSDYVDYGVDTLEYLQHENTHRKTVLLLAIAGLSVATAGYGVFRRGKAAAACSVGSVALDIGIGYALGLMLSFYLVSSSQISATPLRPIPRVAVVLGNASNADVLSSATTSAEAKTTDFGSFITCLQRYGYFPRLCATPDDALTRADRIVLLNPNTAWRTADLRRFQQALVTRKVRLLVADSLCNHESTTNTLVSPFGLRVAVHPIPAQAKCLVPLPNYSKEQTNLIFLLMGTAYHLATGGLTTAELPPPAAQDLVMLTLEGGIPILADVHQNITCTQTLFQNGSKIMVYVDSANLSIQALGGGFMKQLSDDQKDRLQFVKRLLTEFEKE